jgi:diguanylate cyclase (GGDEF)-like protein/PAS domain S-box-containing protein
MGWDADEPSSTVVPDGEMLSALVAHCAEGILIIDRDHRISYMNPAAAELFQREPEAMVGESLHQLLPERFRDRHVSHVEGFAAEHIAGRYMDNDNYDIRGQRGDGTEFPADISILNLTGTSAGGAFAAIVRDCTRQRDREWHWAKLADTDALTGLLNRRGFLTNAETIAAATQRRGTALGIAIADIDNFKQVNDTYGHAVGDEVIQAIIERLRPLLRDADCFGRWGGEELVAALSDADERGASIAGERLRQTLASHPVRSPSLGITIPVTISIGIAVSWQAAGRVQELITRADAALFRAKARGKDVVEVAVDGRCEPDQHHDALVDEASVTEPPSRDQDT